MALPPTIWQKTTCEEPRQAVAAPAVSSCRAMQRPSLSGVPHSPFTWREHSNSTLIPILLFIVAWLDRRAQRPPLGSDIADGCGPALRGKLDGTLHQKVIGTRSSAIGTASSSATFSSNSLNSMPER